MSYVVLARKFRPQTFDEVMDQGHVTLTLKNAIASNRVAHAYLFTGSRGVGKTSTARILAKAVNCESLADGNPCNKCNSCVEITRGSSMDVIEIDGASNRGIDEIRNLRDNVKLVPNSGKFKVYIIDEVHMLTQEAFNALLKTLEEPPHYVKFIFATTSIHKVPATILSRCQRFDFKRISLNKIVDVLKQVCEKEGWEFEEPALFLIAQASDGSMRDSQSLLDQSVNFCVGKISYDRVKQLLGVLGDDVLFELAGLVKSKDMSGLLGLVDRLVDLGVDPIYFLDNMADFFRNIMLSLIGGPVLGTLEKPKEYIDKLAEFKKDFSEGDILYIIHLIMQYKSTIRRSELGRIGLEMLLIKLALKEDMTLISDMIDKLNNLDNKFSDEKVPQTKVSKSISSVESPFGQEVPKMDNQKQTTVESHTDVSTFHKTEGSSGVDHDFKKIWPDVIASVMKDKPSCATCLKDAVVLGVSGNVLKIGFNSECSFSKDMIEQKPNKILLEKSVEQLMGRKINIVFETIADSQGSVNAKQHEPEKRVNKKYDAANSHVVNKIVNLFDANVVGVDEE